MSLWTYFLCIDVKLCFSCHISWTLKIQNIHEDTHERIYNFQILPKYTVLLMLQRKSPNNTKQGVNACTCRILSCYTFTVWLVATPGAFRQKNPHINLQSTAQTPINTKRSIWKRPETSLDGFLQLPDLLRSLQIHRDQGTHGRFHGWWGFSLCWVLESWIVWTVYCDLVWYGTISKSEHHFW